jgi:hypothetical protein
MATYNETRAMSSPIDGAPGERKDGKVELAGHFKRVVFTHFTHFSHSVFLKYPFA